jgi:hypothetical protein
MTNAAERSLIQRINDAWYEEASINRLGLRPAANKEVGLAIIPGGGDWQCVAPKGAITRTITWRATEVALVNPRGDLGDHTEGQIAMGLRATPVMDKALRAIFVLAKDSSNLALIGDIARAAIDYVEQPAPPLHEEEDEGASDEERESQHP